MLSMCRELNVRTLGIDPLGWDWPFTLLPAEGHTSYTPYSLASYHRTYARPSNHKTVN